ncbi:MAG: cob(I)yrinic acid a,c-diamide adenosyltransferase [Patescibacteria group bacterium]
MNRIYTRLGDEGTTAVLDGGRQPKHALIFQTIGEIDELNAQLGVCVVLTDQKKVRVELCAIQHELFAIGAQLASDEVTTYGVAAGAVAALEQQLDTHWAATPPLTRFILPGGTALAAHLHLARTITRRAERSLSALHAHQPQNPITLAYINRLSDYLFALARFENQRSGTREQLWKPRDE